MTAVPEHLRGARWAARQRFVPPPSGLERDLLDKEQRLLTRLADLRAVLAQGSPEDEAVDALLGKAPARPDDEFDREGAAKEADKIQNELRILDKALERLE